VGAQVVLLRKTTSCRLSQVATADRGLAELVRYLADVGSQIDFPYGVPPRLRHLSSSLAGSGLGPAPRPPSPARACPPCHGNRRCPWPRLSSICSPSGRQYKVGKPNPRPASPCAGHTHGHGGWSRLHRHQARGRRRGLPFKHLPSQLPAEAHTPGARAILCKGGSVLANLLADETAGSDSLCIAGWVLTPRPVPPPAGRTRLTHGRGCRHRPSARGHGGTGRLPRPPS
jgi:hypothetical protein